MEVIRLLRILYQYLPVTFIVLANLAFVFTWNYLSERRYFEDCPLLTISFAAFFFIFFCILFFIATKAHQTFETEPSAYEPISIIVPVYNEELHIFSVLKSIQNSHYPTEKIELIVINDGSSDNSQNEIIRFSEQYKGEFTFINLKENRGKKNGLLKGFEIAKNEIIVTIDSDTFIEKDGIIHLIRKFEKEVSAVSGYTDVHNHDQNLITRIQWYEYFVSHHLFKAFESFYQSVLCCPGCFSAYRKESLNSIIDEFKSSSVYGFPIDYAEDRYLTALLLRNNHKVVYSSQARAHTIVPNSLKSFFIQRFRWIKSWFINSLFLVKTALHRPFVYSLYFYLSLIFNILIVSVPFLFVYLIFTDQVVIILSGLYVVLLYILFHLWKTKKLKLLLPILFFLFTISVYSWLLVAAVSKIKDSSWGKRVGES
jgi:hyaluronan synthase